MIVVGGGISGAGIARDAALRGLKVAVFEKCDYGSGTSSRSSKLIHGGLRYLENYNFHLVYESVRERYVQSRLAPHLVSSVPFVLPIYDDDAHGLEMVNLGLWIYDALALFRAPRLHKTLRGQSASGMLPGLEPSGLQGAISYSDCVTDDARLVLENILDAELLGACCRSYVEVEAMRDSPYGRFKELTLRDTLGDEATTVTTRSVVIAAGPWTDEVLKTWDLGARSNVLRPTKGVHLVFPHDCLPVDQAITLRSRIDDRVVFVIPWRGRTVVGTTDTDFHGNPDDVACDASDVEYLCRSIGEYFPSARVDSTTVISTWAGIRPLINDGDELEESDVSREHEIFSRGDGVFVIAGGKLTTYRLMAKECVDDVANWLRDYDDSFDRPIPSSTTHKRPLPGARGLDSPDEIGLRRLAVSLTSDGPLSLEACIHLSSIYGTRAQAIIDGIARAPALGEPIDPELPYLWGEVLFAVEHELARTLDDILSRRIPLLLLARDQGSGVAEGVGRLLSQRGLWNDAEYERHLIAYRRVISASRRCLGSKAAPIP